MCSLELRAKEEKDLRFKEFTNQIAFDIGTALIDKAKDNGYNLAICVTINKREVFRYAMSGSTSMNDEWTRRKANTVYLSEKATLHIREFWEAQGTTIEKQWDLDKAIYGDFGGGFPIRLENGVVIRTICVSGLPHEKDHKVIVDTLYEYLGVTK